MTFHIEDTQHILHSFVLVEKLLALWRAEIPPLWELVQLILWCSWSKLCCSCLWRNYKLTTHVEGFIVSTRRSRRPRGSNPIVPSPSCGEVIDLLCSPRSGYEINNSHTAESFRGKLFASKNRTGISSPGLVLIARIVGKPLAMVGGSWGGHLITFYHTPLFSRRTNSPPT